MQRELNVALGRFSSEHLDPRQLAHASIEACSEVATLPSMLGDDQAAGEPSQARFEQGQGCCDRFTVLECERSLVEQAAYRDQLRTLVLLEGRFQRPDRFHQDDIRHQQ